MQKRARNNAFFSKKSKKVKKVPIFPPLARRRVLFLPFFSQKNASSALRRAEYAPRFPPLLFCLFSPTATTAAIRATPTTDAFVLTHCFNTFLPFVATVFGGKISKSG